MNELNLEVRVTEEKVKKRYFYRNKCDFDEGKGLFSMKRFTKGDIIFQEVPLVCCQFAWNEDFGYKACEFCLRPLETAVENVQRLTMNEFSHLPFSQLCGIDKGSHVSCIHCGVEYCSHECMKTAWENYHRTLCLQTCERSGSHPLEILKETWKQMHYPPETTTIMLFMKIFAMIHQSENKEAIKNIFKEFCHKIINENENITHKLLGLKFANQVETLREAVISFAPSEDIQEWLTMDGFLQLMALIGMNGQGIGTSSFGEWVKNVSELNLPIEEKESLNLLIEKIYENFEKGVGEFLNNEGSGLYRVQSCINHSCRPNAEITFPNANHQLAVRAIDDINPGDEICISYLDECILERRRHSRQKILKENYLFTCKCQRCEEQTDEPDETSSEESDEDCES